MDTESLLRQVQTLRDVLGLRPHEWARGRGLTREELDIAYDLAMADAQRQASAVVVQLLQAGKHDFLDILLRNASSNLIVAVSQAIGATSCEQGLGPLMREYRGSSNDAKCSILGVTASRGDASAFELVQEATGDGAPAVAKAALAAKHCLLERDPALAFVAATSSGQQPEAMVESVIPKVSEYLCSVVSLNTALNSLRYARKTFPRVAEELKGYLIGLSKVGLGSRATAARRAALLLASQSWDVPRQVMSSAAFSFARGTGEDRLALMGCERPSVIRLLSSCLTAKAPTVVAAAIHEIEALPDLARDLSGPLRRIESISDLSIGTRVRLILYGNNMAGERADGLAETLAQALKLEETEPLHERIIVALLRTDLGQALLAADALSQSTWDRLISILARSDMAPARTRFLRELLAHDPGPAAPGALARLVWAVETAQAMETEEAGDVSSMLTAMLAAYLSRGSDEVAEVLIRSLPNNTLIRGAEASVAESLIGDPSRMRMWLTRPSIGRESILKSIRAVLTRLQGSVEVLSELAYARLTTAEFKAWLDTEDQSGSFCRLLRADLARRYACIRELSAEYLREDESDRTDLARISDEMLNGLDAAIDDKAADSDNSLLHALVGDIASSVFRVIDAPGGQIPQPPDATDDISMDLAQTLVVERSLSHLKAARSPGLRLEIAASAMVDVERFLMALRKHPNREYIIEPIDAWLVQLGLGHVEARVGTSTTFDPTLHMSDQQGLTLGTTCEVLTYGLKSNDGTIVRKAMVMRI